MALPDRRNMHRRACSSVAAAVVLTTLAAAGASTQSPTVALSGLLLDRGHHAPIVAPAAGMRLLPSPSTIAVR